jgi:undecaprenyl-diphosphatase
MTLTGSPTTAPVGARAADHSRQALEDARWLLTAILSLAALLVPSLVVATGVVVPFDQSLLALARTWDGQPLVWQVITQSANIPLIVIAVGFMAWLFLTKRRREALLVLLILAAVTGGSEGLKQLVGRPRPSGTGDGIPGVIFSYPSGHVLEVLSILGIIAVRIWRNTISSPLRLIVVVVVVVEVVLVGISRLALDEHYPTDLLAGLLGGIAAISLYPGSTDR